MLLMHWILMGVLYSISIVLYYCNPLQILFYFILFYFILFYSIVLYCIVLYCIVLLRIVTTM